MLQATRVNDADDPEPDAPLAIRDIPLRLPRSAFSPRDTARAGDLWRAFQEIAVEAAEQAGWSPERFRREGTAFIVRQMKVRHHRESTYGETLTGRTWVWRFRRDMLSTREVRLLAGEDLLASGTQEWVHVSAELKPTPGSRELLDSFPPYEGGESVRLPDWEPHEGPDHRFELECWYTWMDALGHVNHPTYVDWADEAVSRVMAEAGVAPVRLQPVAEKVTFHFGATARDRLRIVTHMAGLTAEGYPVLRHRVLKEDDTICARITTVRCLADGDPAPFARAFQ